MEHSSLGNKQIFAENLKYYMQRDGINGVILSDKIDVPVTTISNWLHANNYPRIDKIEKMAEFFHIRKSDLVEKRLAGEQADVDADLLSVFHQLDREGQRYIIEMTKLFLKQNSISHEAE